MAELSVTSDAESCRQLGYTTAADALLDPRGITLRSVPWRRTIQRRLPDGSRVYTKLRYGRRAEALLEWEALGQLEALGLRGPRRILLAGRGRDTALVLAEVAGRAALQTLQAAGCTPARQRRLIDAVAPAIARLHGAGWYYRDLYWHHLYLDAGDQLSFIDAERMIHPRWRRTRWRIKDLAGLVASLPPRISKAMQLRFLRRYLGGGFAPDWKELARAVVQKAARIRRHRPKFG